MCGIFGTVNYRLSAGQFQHQLDALKHRGPDGFGIWESEDAGVQIGHRRLAIIDTCARSNQPMLFGDRYVLTYNGEIYNYLEIKKELQQKGVHFHTESDTEVLFQLMILEGPSALTKLNGMWSFVLYDQQEQSLFMSRDRIGKKPLYYIHEGEQFAFASEMKGLYDCLPEFSYHRSFIDFSVANPSENEVLPGTIINGIHKFPAGCYGVFRRGVLTITRYYFPERLLEQKPTYRNFNEAVEQFRELFESSCSLRMRSDVPVGSSLSGGIDSGYVVSTIGKLGSGREAGYTAVVSSFPGSALDETQDALLVAANAGVDAVKVIVQAEITPEKILKAVYDFEEIAGTAPIPFFQTYAAFRENNIVVTLDGHGGDELFGGYTFDMYAKLRDDFPNLLTMRNTLQTIDQMYGFKTRIELKDAWPHFKGIALNKKKEMGLTRIFSKEQVYKEKLYHSTFKGILPTLLRNYDRYSMHAGVEVRMPFLDYRIIEFAFTLPNDYKVRNGFSKAIVREAAKDIVPAHILRNKLKSGWNSPMGEWLAGSWKQWLLDEVNSTAFANCDLMDTSEFRKKVDLFYNAPKPEQNEGQQLWLHLQPYLIEQANKKFASSYAGRTV